MSGSDLDRVLRAFDAPEPARNGRPADLAAVLIALYDGPHGAEVLYTRRSEALRSHPGEISFPGGRVDPHESPREAALREAEEEVGLRPRDLARVGHLLDYETYRGTTVCAYVAHGLGEPPRAPASTEEVAEVFTVPVASLLDPDAYEARRLDPMPPGRRVHYWSIPPRVIWGITGEITAQFLQRAYGWRLPDRVRTVRDVEEFLPRR